jgi:hypothetical protein
MTFRYKTVAKQQASQMILVVRYEKRPHSLGDRWLPIITCLLSEAQ